MSTPSNRQSRIPRGARRHHALTSAEVLDGALGDWLRLPARQHLIAFAALVVLVVIRYDDLLVHPDAWIDESIYQEGFAALLAGNSPYDVDFPSHGGFYYPPPFAHAGAFLLDHLGAELLRFLVRGLNVLSVAWIAWLAVAWLPAPRGDRQRGFVLRFFVAALLVVAPMGIAFGFRVGNISFLIAALVLTAVTFSHLRPIGAGVLLGLSLVLKPLAPVVVAVLFAQKPGGRAAARGRLAALSAGLTAGLLCLPFLDELGVLLTQRLSPLVEGRILSSYRVAQLIGVPFDRSLVFVLLTLAWMALVWRLGRARCTVVALAVGGVVLTAPAVWSHTMTIFFPVLAMAAVLAFRHWSALRAREPGSTAGRHGAHELMLVAVALVASLYFQSGGFDHMAEGAQIGLLVPLLLIPLLVVGYVVGVASRPSPEA